MPKHYVVDLEALSTRADGVVMSVGVVEVHKQPITKLWTRTERTFYRTFPMFEQVEKGRDVDTDTRNWWRTTPNAEARKVITESLLEHHSVGFRLTELARWLTLECTIDDVYLWGFGAAYDNAVLTNLCSDFKIPKLCGYRNDRCFRTALGSMPRLDRFSSEIPHHALYDAIAEADKLCEIQNRLDQVPGNPVTFLF